VNASAHREERSAKVVNEPSAQRQDLDDANAKEAMKDQADRIATVKRRSNFECEAVQASCELIANHAIHRFPNGQD